MSDEHDPIQVLYRRSGKPLADRSETISVVKALHGDETPSESSSSSTKKQLPRPPLSNVHGGGPLLLSDIPASCKQPGVVVGIDEAGRGSVLGPMIYGAAYWNRSQAETIPKGFNDSKQLSEDTRTKLFGKILHTTPELGFCIRVLHSSEISRNMLRKEPYNLNQMSHDSAIEIIRKLIEAGVQIETCYIDTVGNPETYKRRLDGEFPGIGFVVESKADANYAPCSAGSVVAKVTRDRMIANWQFSEPLLEANTKFGSGYPSDPTCKKWMEDNQSCNIFGFSDVIRFSWAPSKKALEKNSVPVTFQADVDEDDPQFIVGMKRQQDQMSAFLGKKESSRKKTRYPFYERKHMEAVIKL